MKRKNISILLIITIITAIFFTACEDKKEENKENIKENHQASILKKFTKISEIPRNNGDDMTGIKDYIQRRAGRLNLEVKTDEAGNMMIEMPATPGYENAPTTILQTNIDMKTIASPSIVFDEKKDPVTPIINENTNTITGNNTSLGASSGLGIASSIFVLQNTVSHGGIKAVFTVDGEGKLTGAKNIDKSFLEGDYLINMNNNRINDIDISGSLSSDLECKKEIKMNNTKNKYSFVLVADGFIGGDAGLAAQNNQGNPIMFLSEVLALAKSQGLMFELNDFQSGNNDAEIPEKATATITVNDYEKKKINTIFDEAKNSYLNEYGESDPDAKLEIIETRTPEKSLTDDDAGYLISFLYGIVDGRYNKDDETTDSSSAVSVKIKNDKISVKIFVQAQTDTVMNEIITDHSQIAKISNMSMDVKDKTAGFKTAESDYLPEKIKEIFSSKFELSTEFTNNPTRTELSYFQEKNPNLKLISIGPTIENENEINETVSLDTVDIPASAVVMFLSGLQG